MRKFVQRNHSMPKHFDSSDINLFTGSTVRSKAVLLRTILLALVASAGFQSLATAQIKSSFNLAETSATSAGLPGSAVAVVATEQVPDRGDAARRANFGQEIASRETQKLADWVVDSANNTRLPFVIVDKIQAKVFVFDALGQLRGSASALVGAAVGDDSVPGIGQRKLSSIRPHERTTAAGRFVASLDRDLHGKELLWVDYDTALSLHPVVKGLPSEHRAERLASPSPLDKRVSFGCINVPVKFYHDVVSPAFTGTNGIVYILPETRSAQEVFGSYDVQDPSRQQVSARAAPQSPMAPQ